jgi:hypothetical protein
MPLKCGHDRVYLAATPSDIWRPIKAKGPCPGSWKICRSTSFPAPQGTRWGRQPRPSGHRCWRVLPSTGTPGRLRQMDGEVAPASDGGDLRGPLRVEVFATLLHRQARDTGTMLRFLADRLANALPEAVTILHRGPFGLGRILGVRISLPTAHFELRPGPAGTLAATVGRAVGGVVLRRDPVPVDGWIDDLAAALAELAAESESARYALRTIVA